MLCSMFVWSNVVETHVPPLYTIILCDYWIGYLGLFMYVFQTIKITIHKFMLLIKIVKTYYLSPCIVFDIQIWMFCPVSVFDT